MTEIIFLTGCVTLSIALTVKLHAFPATPFTDLPILLITLVTLSTASTATFHLVLFISSSRFLVFSFALSNAVTFFVAELMPGSVLSLTLTGMSITNASRAIFTPSFPFHFDKLLSVCACSSEVLSYVVRWLVFKLTLIQKFKNIQKRLNYAKRISRFIDLSRLDSFHPVFQMRDTVFDLAFRCLLVCLEFCIGSLLLFFFELHSQTMAFHRFFGIPFLENLRMTVLFQEKLPLVSPPFL